MFLTKNQQSYLAKIHMKFHSPTKAHIIILLLFFLPYLCYLFYFDQLFKTHETYFLITRLSFVFITTFVYFFAFILLHFSFKQKISSFVVIFYFIISFILIKEKSFVLINDVFSYFDLFPDLLKTRSSSGLNKTAPIQYSLMLPLLVSSVVYLLSFIYRPISVQKIFFGLYVLIFCVFFLVIHSVVSISSYKYYQKTLSDRDLLISYNYQNSQTLCDTLSYQCFTVNKDLLLGSNFQDNIKFRTNSVKNAFGDNIQSKLLSNKEEVDRFKSIVNNFIESNKKAESIISSNFLPGDLQNQNFSLFKVDDNNIFIIVDSVSAEKTQSFYIELTSYVFFFFLFFYTPLFYWLYIKHSKKALLKNIDGKHIRFRLEL